ncbi:YdcF family protein [Kurthia massiliensis]|uniref:YdcF family protein n=1 Tax=Kurthia massiliensis TaxID=1033739 RepID=UPI000287CBE2|nr:YdcF family protein [Kurthia massiliensis]
MIWFAVAMLVVLGLLYWLAPRSFFNVYVCGFVFGLFGLLGMIYILPDITSETEIVSRFYIILFFAIIPLILCALSILTFFNGKILLEKEGRRPKNLLFSAIGVVIIGMVIWYLMLHRFSTASEVVFVYAVGVVGYFLYLFTSTTLYAILYHYRPILYKPDYIIVLGSGLIGKKVPPLLASRINKAVDVWREHRSATIIMSGGQGADELMSEAEAMRDYALAHHSDIDPSQILVENQSTTTYENFLLSKQLIEQRTKIYRAVFVTNNFHVFRASLYARKLKVKAQGVGSKTATYYLANAFTREYIALLVMTKWIHIVLMGLWTIICLFLLRAYL